ncbi:MAG: NUDIX domain-containing protein [Bacteriovoracaceae bacterium]|nr:NUDIX domain-containing protein [Bacteriovoracaceae bacterium]
MKISPTKKKVQVVVVRYDKLMDQWFILRLRTNKKRGRFWQNVTGSIEVFDKSFRQGALRELREETNIKNKAVLKCTSLKFEYKYFSKQGMPILEKCFVAIVNGDKIKIDSKEHDLYEWKTIEKIKKADYKHPLNFKASKLAIGLVAL